MDSKFSANFLSIKFSKWTRNSRVPPRTIIETKLSNRHVLPYFDAGTNDRFAGTQPCRSMQAENMATVVERWVWCMLNEVEILGSGWIIREMWLARLCMEAEVIELELVQRSGLCQRVLLPWERKRLLLSADGYDNSAFANKHRLFHRRWNSDE